MRRLFVLTIFITLCAVPAFADTYASVWAGVNFQSDPLTSVARSAAVGGDVGLTSGILSAEADLGYAPRYFNAGTGSVTTVMGNVVVDLPVDIGVKPYVTAGLGLINTQVPTGTAS